MIDDYGLSHGLSPQKKENYSSFSPRPACGVVHVLKALLDRGHQLSSAANSDRAEFLQPHRSLSISK